MTRSTDNMRSDRSRDIANLDSYDQYLDAMQAVFAESRSLLRDRGYMAVIVRNAYQDGEYRFVSADIAARARIAGLIPKGGIVWSQTGSRLRPYGYPHAYVPNIIHQSIVILRKDTRRD